MGPLRYNIKLLEANLHYTGIGKVFLNRLQKVLPVRSVASKPALF